jgi:hypothetical protein
VIENPKLLDKGALVEVIKDGVGHRGLAGVPQRKFADTLNTLWPDVPRPS